MAPTKFTFDTAFGDQAREQEKAEKEALLREVDAAEARGREAGVQAGRQQALAEIEAQVNNAFQQISEQCTALFSQQEALASDIRQDTAQLAHAIASRLAPALMARKPLEEVEALVSECLEFCRREPRLVVRVPDAMVEPLSQRLEPLKVSRGFTGDIILLGDPALHGFDCRVEWPDGGVERNHEEIADAIERTVQRYVMSEEEAGQEGRVATLRTATI